MKIYTKTGDLGETGLFGGGRVSKDAIRVEAYGAVDELNACLGLVRALPKKEFEIELGRIAAELFTVGSLLATPHDSKASKVVPQINATWIAKMEQIIDTLDGELPPLKSFILPGGTSLSAALHHARTVCRRAERRVVTLSKVETIDMGVIVYLNRLSDLLFTMARAANFREGVEDVPWTAPAS